MDEAIADHVRDAYSKTALGGKDVTGDAESHSRDIVADCLKMGYSQEDLAKGDQGDANMGLGCGAPVALAKLQPGEVVVDLGSGGGFDCFLAADRVGLTGTVVGVDMTAEMLAKARKNAKDRGFKHVTFRLGEVEYLPVGDGVADVIISNGVICLCADQAQVFREAYRILKPGGRLCVCDMVQNRPLPPELRTAKAWAS